MKPDAGGGGGMKTFTHPNSTDARRRRGEVAQALAKVTARNKAR
jgi:hypothetical protein